MLLVNRPPAKPGAYSVNASKAPNNTVRRLRAAHTTTPSPFQGEGGDGGARREHGTRAAALHPLPRPSPERGRERNLDCGNGRTVVGPPGEPGVYLKLNLRKVWTSSHSGECRHPETPIQTAGFRRDDTDLGFRQWPLAEYRCGFRPMLAHGREACLVTVA